MYAQRLLRNIWYPLLIMCVCVSVSVCVYTYVYIYIHTYVYIYIADSAAKHLVPAAAVVFRPLLLPDTRRPAAAGTHTHTHTHTPFVFRPLLLPGSRSTAGCQVEKKKKKSGVDGGEWEWVGVSQRAGGAGALAAT